MTKIKPGTPEDIARASVQVMLTEGSPVTPDHREIDPATGMQKAYVVLSDDERAKGFVEPVRRSYVHQACGVVTTMGLSIAETYARDPSFYGRTFCAGCGSHFPVGEHGQFVWDGTSQKVGTRGLKSRLTAINWSDPIPHDGSPGCPDEARDGPCMVFGQNGDWEIITPEDGPGWAICWPNVTHYCTPITQPAPDPAQALLDALKRFHEYGCPDCGGDCSSANPPIALCIMRQAHDAITAYNEAQK